jgi:gamma-glutamyltranspeptidase/glutathione hydrolase
MGAGSLRAEGARWAVAAPHALATEAGARAFGEGGNAADAALAAAAVLAVVYPHQCGVGGDLFALVRDPDGKVVAINASGAAPRGIDVEAVRAAGGGRMPERGPLTITVPGGPSGWAALHRHARLPFSRAFAEAAALAEEGVAVAGAVGRSIQRNLELILADPGLAAVFAPSGRPLRTGERLAQPALARTLRAIAEGGAEVLYRGEVGERLVAGLRSRGSPIAPEDLRAHQAELDSALAARYRDLDVLVAPPNSQGFVLLEILLAIEHLGIDPDPVGPDVALLAEVCRAASIDRDRHNADPRRARVQLGNLLDDGHIAALCDEVRGTRSASGPGAGGGAPTSRRSGDGDTVAVVAADADGWAVSLVQSLWSGWGAGILEPTTGILLHDRGNCFSLDPSSPNVLEPGKRPAHTLTPALVAREGRLAAALGTRGGGGQPQILAHLLARVVDLGMDPAEALAAPRWLVHGMDVGRTDRYLQAESDAPPAALAALEAAGFDLVRLPPRSEDVGHAHLVLATPGGFVAAADPRSDGAASAG